MENQSEPDDKYHPIHFDFCVELEAALEQRTDCAFIYQDDSGPYCEVTAQVRDLYTDEGIEYIRLDNHQVFRLDQIRVLNGREVVGGR